MHFAKRDAFVWKGELFGWSSCQGVLEGSDLVLALSFKIFCCVGSDYAKGLGNSLCQRGSSQA